MQVVNAVGGGELKRGIQIDELEASLPARLSLNSTHSELYITNGEDYPTITLFRSGKYSIAGAGSVNQLFDVNKEFLRILSDITEWDLISQAEFEVRYLVGIGDVDTKIDLDELVESLPISKVEYEPEQFPGLFYYPSDDTTIIVFSTGKVSINGPISRGQLVKNLDKIKKKIG